MPRSKNPDNYSFEWHELAALLADAHPEKIQLPAKDYKQAFADRHTWYSFISANNHERLIALKQKDFPKAEKLNNTLRVLRHYEALIEKDNNGIPCLTLRSRESSPQAQRLRQLNAQLREQYADEIEETRQMQRELNAMNGGGVTPNMQELSRAQAKEFEDYIAEAFNKKAENSKAPPEDLLSDEEYQRVMTQNMEKKS